MHKPTKQAIYNKFITTNKNIAVSATAGSGKTSTLVEIAKLIAYNKKAIFTAFNKHIVNELKKRLPANVETSTLHSLGFKCIRGHFRGEVKLNDKKQIDFILPLFDKIENQRKKWKSIYVVDHIMKLARMTMTEPNREALGLLIEKYVIDITEPEIAATIASMRKLKAYNSDIDRFNFTCDFVDMIEFPALNNIKLPQYDYVLIDESQDMSTLDRLLLNKLVKPITGRKIIVGDKNQAIYSFRGSDIDSFAKFANEPNTIQLPLTVSYRCSKAVVREAQKVYPEIESYEENEEGSVTVGKIEDINENDLVICRNTQSLIEVFLELIEQGKKAYVVGKEMEQGLLNLMAGLNSEDKVNEVWQPFKEREKERVVNQLKDKGVKNPEKNPKFGAFMEKINVLRVLFNKFEYVYQVEEFIKEIFESEDEEREGIKMMTIHRCKGLESERVFFIRKFEDKELIPSQYAVTEEMLTVENNLLFVGITRAKRDLIYLDL